MLFHSKSRNLTICLQLLLHIGLLPPTTTSFSNHQPVAISRSFVPSSPATKTNTCLRGKDSSDENGTELTLKTFVPSLLFSVAIATTHLPDSGAWAASDLFVDDSAVQGISAVTKSELGQSVRRSIVKGAKIADELDLKWERFSDSLRDEQKCDPNTNRRLFDNGLRRDGTRRNAPVLGALCNPVPLKPINQIEVQRVLDLEQDAVLAVLSGTNRAALQQQVSTIQDLVAPSFSRAVTPSDKDDDGFQLEARKRQEYNRDVYTNSRAYSDLLKSKLSSGGPPSSIRDSARQIEVAWGEKLLSSLAPSASKKDFTSPFPPPDPTEEQLYDDEALLNALGAISVSLNRLQDAGMIGHWEISIPEDDYGEVVTIAVDDDVGIGAQILAREQNQPLSPSPVVALVRAALESRAKVSYTIDTFFIDPLTTNQELYNPTQTLISLSNLGQ